MFSVANYLFALSVGILVLWTMISIEVFSKALRLDHLRASGFSVPFLAMSY